MSLAQGDTETKGPDTAAWVLTYPVPGEPISCCPCALVQSAALPWGEVTQKTQASWEPGRNKKLSLRPPGGGLLQPAP